MSELNLTFENMNDPDRGFDEWPETMWPLQPSVLEGLPDQLWPERDELEEMQYPWELLRSLNRVRQETITETVGEEGVEFEDRDLTFIQGPVWFAPGVHVRAMSKIEGPAFIGGNVGSYGFIRESSLARDSLVGTFCEVTRSVVGQNVKTSHRNGAFDSIIDQDVHMAGGARALNFRRDGQPISVTVDGDKIDTGMSHFGSAIGAGAEVGLNSIIMPGKFLGRQCLVGTGVEVYSHIPDDMMVENPRVNLHMRPRR